MSGFNFIHSIVEPIVGHDAVHGVGGLVTSGLVAGAVVAVAAKARKSLANASDPLIPDSNLTLRNIFEVIAGFIVWLGDSAMGKENRKYLPFAATIFVYIFAMNIIGLVPGFAMPTDQFQINLGIALCVFVLYNFWGMREVGVFNYLKSLWGPVFLLGFLLFPIELLSHVIRPVTLGLRLFGNMTGDHLALAIFTDLTKFGVPVLFYVLGTTVCFIQAFVFTLLTMIYIRLAVSHEH